MSLSHYDYKNQLIDRALKVLETAENRIQDAEANDISVTTYVDLEATRQRLLEYRNKKRVRPTTLSYLREASRPTYYDRLIKYNLEVVDENRSTKTSAVTKTVSVSQYEINRLRKKQVTSPDILTEEQNAVLAKWGAATEMSASAEIADLSSPKAEKKFMRAFKVDRDVGIGGASLLINKLSYTYDAVPSGREFVLWLQNIMKDPKVFVEIEKWFRMNWQVQMAIDQAVNKEWYRNFKSFANMIVEFIDSISKQMNIEIPDNILRRAETDSESYYEGY